MEEKKKAGRPKKWLYKGDKKITSIRLTDEEKELIKYKFGTTQAFIEFCLDKIKTKKMRE